MNLEAQAAREGEEKDDAWEVDDELFIGGPTPAGSPVSHAQHRLEFDRANEVHGEVWSSFLERATTRTSLGPSNAQDEPRVFVGKVPIWKVPVKAGWEEIIAFKVLETQLVRKNVAPSILLATGRASFPGFILVETQFASDGILFPQA